MNKDQFPRVPYGSTVHGEEEIAAIVEVLRSSTQMGTKVNLFEERIAELFVKDFGLMTNSGSSALYLAIESLGLEEGSEVITPPLTFATTVACLVKNSLIPSFVDVRKDTYCIDERLIEEAVTSKTKAILAPDLLGNLCDWKEIRRIADKNKNSFYESGLLKLNVNKAKIKLQWKSILTLNETINMVTEWYKSYYLNPKKIYTISLSQIKKYENLLKKRTII